MATQTSLFEAMPLELHFKVLSHLSSPEDVLSTMRASPAALKAIAIGRERVYASALETALAPEVFRELLAIVNAPDHNKCPHVPPPSQETNDASIEEWRAWERRVRSFLKSHAHGAVYPSPDPHVDIIKFKTEIQFMVRLSLCLSKFVNFYQIFVQSIARHTWPVVRPACRIEQVQDHDWPPLTETELLRLQRGLLRHEMCCRLLGMPSHDLDCNEDFIYQLADDQIEPHHPGYDNLWWLHPFHDLLPIDELEEVSCASTYLMGLLQMYVGDVRADLQNHLLVLAQGNGNQALDKDGIDEKMETVGILLSQARSQHPMMGLDLRGKYLARNWVEIMSQLGLVFLNRMTKSTAADHRELMRSTFYTFRGAFAPEFQRLHWFADGFNKQPGPYCSPMTKSFVMNRLNIDGLDADRTDCLRALGWAVFDDHSKLRSLGLQPDGNISTVRTWVLEARENHDFWPSIRLKMPASSMNTSISKDDWYEKVIAICSSRDQRNDYHAMTRFAAGIRAVIDFKSAQLPTFD